MRDYKNDPALPRRAEAFAAPKGAFAGEYAKTAYNAAWAFSQAVHQDRAPQADIERSYALFTDACALFEIRKESFPLAKALDGLSLVSGLLGHTAQSNDASRRALELLEHCEVSSTADKEKRLLIRMKSFRSLAENTTNPTEERIRCAYQGREVLELLTMRRDDPEKYLRHKALFDRALGSAFGRSLPRTIETLRASEEHFTKAIEFFDQIKQPANIKKSVSSKGKAYRDLSRTRRSMAKILEATDPAAAALVLKAALLAAEKALELFISVDDDSHWNHYHHAKALWKLGRTSEALTACMKGVKAIESGRKEYEEEGNRIEWMSAKLPVFDFAICLAHELGESELGFELSQRCKARTFLEKMRGHQTTAPDRAGPDRGVSELAHDLNPGEALLEYHLGRHALSIFLLTPDGSIKTARLPYERARVERMVAAFTDAMRQTRTPESSYVLGLSLKALAKALLLPFLGDLESAQRLYIVPAGLLSYLPFGVLPLPQGGLAVNKWEIVDLPSATLLPRRSAPVPAPVARRILILANPEMNLGHAEEEAVEVSRTFPKSVVKVREKATKLLLEDLGETTHLHLACHGHYSADDGLGSRLNLAACATDDGVLGVAEITGLRLSGVDLAFLSCCKSAHGRHRAGDEFVGVHRAFLMAGARSVVATLWDIEDAITRKLVVSFYKHLNAGERKSAALRRATLEVLSEHPHPYYWAGFKLIGAA